MNYVVVRNESTNESAVCLCLGATGPLYAGYMLAGGYSWRLYFYVETALAGALLVLAFFVVEESMYKRKADFDTSSPTSETGSQSKNIEGNLTTEHIESHNIPTRNSFVSTLKPWSWIDYESEFFLTMARSFTHFFVPAVFWVITTYGESNFKGYESMLNTKQVSTLVLVLLLSTTHSQLKSLHLLTRGRRSVPISSIYNSFLINHRKIPA